MSLEVQFESGGKLLRKALLGQPFGYGNNIIIKYKTMDSIAAIAGYSKETGIIARIAR